MNKKLPTLEMILNTFPNAPVTLYIYSKKEKKLVTIFKSKRVRLTDHKLQDLLGQGSVMSNLKVDMIRDNEIYLHHSHNQFLNLQAALIDDNE